MNLLKSDIIICAYAQSAAGPGWSNNPLWVIVKDKDGKLQERCIQPDHFNSEIGHLYGISEALHVSLVNAVKLSRNKKYASHLQ